MLLLLSACSRRSAWLCLGCGTNGSGSRQHFVKASWKSVNPGTCPAVVLMLGGLCVFVHLPCSYRSTFVPFIPSSSSTFLPGSFLQSNPHCIFPGLSSPFQCLVLGDFSSLPLLSHPFLLPALGLTLFFFKEAATCAVWFYPLIPLTLPMSSVPCAAAPSPCWMLSSFENFLLHRRIWCGCNWQMPHYGLPCAAH